MSLQTLKKQISILLLVFNLTTSGLFLHDITSDYLYATSVGLTLEITGELIPEVTPGPGLSQEVFYSPRFAIITLIEEEPATEVVIEEKPVTEVVEKTTPEVIISKEIVELPPLKEEEKPLATVIGRLPEKRRPPNPYGPLDFIGPKDIFGSKVVISMQTLAFSWFNIYRAQIIFSLATGWIIYFSLNPIQFHYSGKNLGSSSHKKHKHHAPKT